MTRNRWLVILALALTALVCLAYSNHFHNAFQFDDAHSIVNNVAIRDLRNIPRFFVDASTTSSLPQNQTYRPGVTTLNAIDYALGRGLDPLAFHRSIFIAYLALGVLLFFLYLRIAAQAWPGPWNPFLALLAAGWFLLHTANAETVNYVSQRADSFSTLMVVLALVIYIYKPGWRRYQVYLLPAAFGVLVKPPACVFGVLLFFYVWLFERPEGSRGRAALRSLVAALPALGVAALLLALAGRMTPPYAIPASISKFNYLITQPFVIVHYFDNFVLPLQFSVDSDWRALTTLADDRFLVGTGFIALLVAAAIYSGRRPRGRPLAFGLIWFLVALAPTSSVFPMDEVLNDHRPFFGYIGLVLAFSWAIALLIGRWWHGWRPALQRARWARAALPGLAAAVLLANAWGTYHRNLVWATPESLWHEATINSPNNTRAFMNFGLTQMAKGNYSVAEVYFQRALALAPTYSYVHTNLGILHAATGRNDQAEADFRSGIRYASDNPESYYYFARWLVDQGRYDEARAEVNQVLKLSPRHLGGHELQAQLTPDALYHTLIDKSLSTYQAGDYQQSLEASQAALKYQPASDAAYNNLCAAYNQLGQWTKAAAACRQALAINPGSELAKNNLAVAEREGK